MRYSSFQIDSNDPGEDRVVVWVDDRASVFGVIDGHGGGLAGDLAAKHLGNQGLFPPQTA